MSAILRPIEFTEISDCDEWRLALNELAVGARAMLEHVWSPETAYYGIEVSSQVGPSRGQCGVSTIWLSRYLQRHSVDAAFVNGVLILDGEPHEHIWTEAHHAKFGAQVLDLASDQYPSTVTRPVYVGEQTDAYVQPPLTARRYIPVRYFAPYRVPYRRLVKRFENLEQAIGALPLRSRIPE